MQAVPDVGPLLVVTSDRDLAEELLRLSAAAGLTPEMVVDAGSVRRSWRRAVGVLVGADGAETLAAAGMPRRDGVVLVSREPATALLWQRALAVHADSVAVLPADAAELTGRLSDFLDGADGSCLTAGVMAARGGGGASIVAAGLAVTAARQGVSALLVDADPLAGGIDLVVGCEDSPGLRWPEVTGTSGRVSATALRGALPQVDSLSVLSWDRGSTGCADAGTMRSILTAGQRGARLVVVDLPRRLDEAAAEAAACCNVVLLVCPTEVRSIAGAAGALRVLRESVADIRLVVRHGSRPRADADAVSELLGIPLLGTVPTRRAVVRAIDDGVGIPARAPLAAACRRLLRELDVTGMPP